MSDNLQKDVPIPQGVFLIRNKKSQKLLGLTSNFDIVAQTQADSDLQQWTLNERGPVERSWAKYSITNLGNQSYALGYDTSKDEAPKDKKRIEGIQSNVTWTIWKDMNGIFKIGTLTPTTTLLMEEDTGSGLVLIKEESGGSEQQWELVVIKLNPLTSSEASVREPDGIKPLTRLLPITRSIAQRTVPSGFGSAILPQRIFRFRNRGSQLYLTGGIMFGPNSNCFSVTSQQKDRLMGHNRWYLMGATTPPGGFTLEPYGVASKFWLATIPWPRIAGNGGIVHTNRGYRNNQEAWYFMSRPNNTISIGAEVPPRGDFYVLQGEKEHLTYVALKPFDATEVYQQWNFELV